MLFYLKLKELEKKFKPMMEYSIHTKSYCIEDLYLFN